MTIDTETNHSTQRTTKVIRTVHLVTLDGIKARSGLYTELWETKSSLARIGTVSDICLPLSVSLYKHRRLLIQCPSSLLCPRINLSVKWRQWEKIRDEIKAWCCDVYMNTMCWNVNTVSLLIEIGVMVTALTIGFGYVFRSRAYFRSICSLWQPTNNS